MFDINLLIWSVAAARQNLVYEWRYDIAGSPPKEQFNGKNGEWDNCKIVNVQ